MSIEYKTGILSGVGTVGGIGAVASTMSAAEITGTLATIGGIVGGGMGAGIGMVAAVPMTIGAATAYGTKKYTEHLAAQAAARSAGNIKALAVISAVSLLGFLAYKALNKNKKSEIQPLSEIDLAENTPLLAK